MSAFASNDGRSCSNSFRGLERRAMRAWKWISLIAMAAFLTVGVWLGARHWRVEPLPVRTFHWFDQPSSSPSHALLPQSALKDWNAHLFSTDVVDPAAKYWAPAQGQIDELELYSSEVSLMSPHGWEWSPTVQDPASYNLQFLGVEIGGRKQVLVNAACHIGDESDEDKALWKSRLFIVSDGFICYWHAFYDPETQTFSDLTINGRA